MDFSKLGLGRQLNENVDPLEVAQGTRDNALTGGERQQQGTANLRQKQKQQMSLNKKAEKSGISYASEQLAIQRNRTEVHKIIEKSTVSWRDELEEATSSAVASGRVPTKYDRVGTAASRKVQNNTQRSGDPDPKLSAGVASGRVPTSYDRVRSGAKRKEQQHTQLSADPIQEAVEDNDQAMHPYVDVMPPTVKREKLMLAQGLKAGKEKKGNLEPTEAQEELNFESALQELMEVTGLVDKTKPVAGTRYNRPYRTPVGEVKGLKKAQVKANEADN